MHLQNKNKFTYTLHKYVITCLLILFSIYTNSTFGQDSIKVNVDSTKNSTNLTPKEKELGIRISKDAPKDVVTSYARDSAVLNMVDNIFKLYGEAVVNQTELELKSGVIEIDNKNNILKAYPLFDSTGKIVSEQSFKQGAEPVKFDSIKYNIKTNRAIVKNARTQYGDGFVVSQQIKRNPDQSIFGYKNLYTTCNLDHPHYGISAKKIKVIPGKVIASGPAHLEVSDIPTPLIMPFAVFPINPKQKSGFMMPTYSMENMRGLGLQKGGYYFNINDYLGAIVQFDYFSKGSYGFFNTIQYGKRYQYSGRLQLDYSYTKTGNESDADAQISNDFRVNWTHQLDGKAKPGTNFSASVNFGTGSYNTINAINTSARLDNQYSSNISYSKTWIGKPYSFSAAARHSQSTQSGLVSVTLPELTFNVTQFNPFENKVRVGAPKWYEKITTNYLFNASNKLNFIDSTVTMNDIRFANFDNGIKHSLNIAASYNVLRFFNLSFSIPYNEYWNTKQMYLNYNNVENKNDSTYQNGFYATRDFRFTTSMSTRIYGLKTFKKGKVMGVRHVLTPSINANFQPGFAQSPFNYYYDYTDQRGYTNPYSPYLRSPIGYPQGIINTGSLGFALNNNLQMKVRTSDSTGSKNISLIDGLSISTSYNFFADSMNLAPIALSGRTNIGEKFNLSASAVLNPYVYEKGRAIGTYRTANGLSPVDLRNANLSFGYSINGGAQDKKVEDNRKNNEEAQLLLKNNGIDDYYDFNIPWNLVLNGGLNYLKISTFAGHDSTSITPNLSLSGSIKFTDKLMFNFSSGVDFRTKAMGYTTFNITRDLHCWQMMLNLVPFGYYRSFNFAINVKASSLQDLKLTRRKSYQDNY